MAGRERVKAAGDAPSGWSDGYPDLYWSAGVAVAPAPVRPTRTPVLSPTKPGRAIVPTRPLFTVAEEIRGAAVAISAVVASSFADRLVAPSLEDYRVRRRRDGAGLIEADLKVIGGPKLPIAIKLPMCERQWLSQDELRRRLQALLASAAIAAALLKHMRQAVRERQAAIDADGVNIRLATRLAPFIPTLDPYQEPEHAVIVTAKGGLDDMLRPEREEWRIDTADALDDKLNELRSALARRSPMATRLNALGAVGFVDQVVLKVLDTLPGSRAGHLAKLARHPVLYGRVAVPGHGEADVDLRWKDGVVRAGMYVGRGVYWSGDKLLIYSPFRTFESLGRPLTDIVDHPFLHGLTVHQVLGKWGDEVRVQKQPMLPFSTRGELLSRD